VGALDVKALQIQSWATRLIFLEDLLKAYDEHVDFKADGAYKSLDELAEAFGKASHMVGHDALLISMDRIHSLPHPQPDGVQPDELRYINTLTGDLLAGAVGDIGLAADLRCASCFAFGAYDLTAPQKTFFTALLKMATRDDPSIEDGTPTEQAQAAAALWQASTPPPTWLMIYATEARAMGEIARRALPRVESTRSLLQAAGRTQRASPTNPVTVLI